MSRLILLLFIAFAFQVSCYLSCKCDSCDCECYDHCHDHQKGSAGCVCFENSENNQCCDLICPEIHVETATNPCRMTTQSYSVPKSCCCAPFCSIPSPQSVSVSHQPMPGSHTICTPEASCVTPPCVQPIYRPPENIRACPGPPPRPPPPMGCCMPYSMTPSAAPSYCVQSVVVGGKSDPGDKKGEDRGRANEPRRVGNDVGSRILGSSHHSTPNQGGNGGLLGGFLGGGGLTGRDGTIFGALGGLLGSTPPGGSNPSVGNTRYPGSNVIGRSRDKDPSSRGEDREDDKRYEKYVDKILDVMKNKLEPECLGPSPIMVVSSPERIRVKKVRRRKTCKYEVDSSEEPDVVVEEEDDPMPYIISKPWSRRRMCRRPRMRRFRCCC